jgi:hypothetical protein
MINFFKNYFKAIKNLVIKYPIIVVVVFNFIYSFYGLVIKYFYPIDYTFFWSQLKPKLYGETIEISWIESVFGLLRHHFLGFFVTILLVGGEELKYRYWLGNNLHNKYLARFFFCSFLIYIGIIITTFLKNPQYKNSQYIDNSNYSTFPNYWWEIENFLTYFAIVTGLAFLLCVVIQFIDFLLWKSTNKQLILWDFINLKAKFWFWISSIVFVFSHTQALESFGYGTIYGFLKLLNLCTLPFVFYFYGFRVTLLVHLLWNFYMNYQFMINVSIYLVLIYNIFYWAIFAVLGYNLWWSIKQHVNKKLITT